MFHVSMHCFLFCRARSHLPLQYRKTMSTRSLISTDSDWKFRRLQLARRSHRSKRFCRRCLVCSSQICWSNSNFRLENMRCCRQSSAQQAKVSSGGRHVSQERTDAGRVESESWHGGGTDAQGAFAQEERIILELELCFPPELFPAAWIFYFLLYNKQVHPFHCSNNHSVIVEISEELYVLSHVFGNTGTRKNIAICRHRPCYM